MARHVTLAAVCIRPQPLGPGRTWDDLLPEVGRYADRAAALGADIVAFPEVYPQTGLQNPARHAAADTLDGPGVTGVAKHARRLGMNLLWATILQEEGRFHNSAVLLDRDGKVGGVYHKMHPTIGELDDGITPGEAPGVFDTDIGRIGTCICFDLNFPDTMLGLKQAGAEAVLFTSAYRGGLQVQMWAWELGAFFACAIRGELGLIVDRGGRVLRESSWEEPVIHQRVNLDSRLMHLDENERKTDALLARYGTGIKLDYYDRERMWVVSAEREGLSIGEVMREFGLEDREAYFARSNARLEQARARR